ncbi:hypothetical protein JXC34_03615 [Candidatus Woesearchaeota archaeon]|nr:hypothetical protein [Candidatus Woesearchaeota archaeon]
MPSYRQIKKMYSDIPKLFGVMGRDLYVLENIVVPHYSPRDSPLIMVVGGTDAEPYVLRLFHERSYSIPKEEVILVACNTREYVCMEHIGYNAVRDGPMLGDGGNDSVWRMLASPSGKKDYDMALFRFPDFFDYNSWYGAYDRALTHVRVGGVIVTITQYKDLGRFTNVMNLVKEKKGVAPNLIQKTGIIDEYGEQDICMHTVAIFKK